MTLLLSLRLSSPSFSPSLSPSFSPSSPYFSPSSSPSFLSFLLSFSFSFDTEEEGFPLGRRIIRGREQSKPSPFSDAIVSSLTRHGSALPLVGRVVDVLDAVIVAGGCDKALLASDAALITALQAVIDGPLAALQQGQEKGQQGGQEEGEGKREGKGEGKSSDRRDSWDSEEEEEEAALAAAAALLSLRVGSALEALTSEEAATPEDALRLYRTLSHYSIYTL